MKKFEIAMVIQAIDKVTGPAKGITASIRKMAAQGEEAANHSSKNAAHHAKEHAKHHSHGIGGFLKEGFEKAFEFVPEIAGVSIGIEGAVEGFKKLTEASDEAAAAQTRLANMMLHVKGNTKADVEEVNELAEKLEGKTAYKHTIFEMAASQLSAFGMNGKQVRAMLPAMADYLAMQNGIGATNEDAIAGAKLLGKAYSGNVGALRRAGVVFSAAQEAILKHGTASQKTAVLIKGIESKSGGLAGKQLLDDKGQDQQAKNVFEKIKEKLGAALSPIRQVWRKALAASVPVLSEFADNFPKLLARGGNALNAVGSRLSASFGQGFSGANIGGFTKTFDSLRPLIMRVLGPIIPLFSSIASFIFKAAGQIGKWLVDLWVNAQPGLKALAEAFAPIIDALANLWHKILVPLWDSVLAPLLGWLIGKLAPFLINVLGPVFRVLGKIIGWTLNTIINLISGLFTWLAKVWPIVSKFFVSLWGKIKIAFGGLKAILTVVWQDIWSGLFQWVEDKWGAFLDIFRKVGNYLGFGGASGQSGSSQSAASSAFRPASSMVLPGMLGGAQDASTTINGRIHVSHDRGLKVKTYDPYDLLHVQLGTQSGFH